MTLLTGDGRKNVAVPFICFFFLQTVCSVPVWAELPPEVLEAAPGQMVNASPAQVPPLLNGLVLSSDAPFRFTFLLTTGSTPLEREAVPSQARRLMQYFLLGLTLPEKDVWVNLSPYEKQRITSSSLGQTVLGRDMLAQDYLLKQLAASLIYPDAPQGKVFWDRVYAEASRRYGTARLPVRTFHKVWVVPERAQVYEKEDRAVITGSRLKVLMEEDYLARRKSAGQQGPEAADTSQEADVSAQIFREEILPLIEEEVNAGETFAPLRQIYHALILARWYKETLRENIFSRVFVDQGKTAGTAPEDALVKEKIYQRYLEAFRQGVFNYIREDVDVATGRVLPRRYFSGGENMSFAQGVFSKDGTAGQAEAVLKEQGTVYEIKAMGDFIREALPPEDRQYLEAAEKGLEGDYSPENIRALIDSIDADGASVMDRDIARMDPSKRQEHFFTALTEGQPRMKDGGRVYFLDGVDSVEAMMQTVADALRVLEAHKDAWAAQRAPAVLKALQSAGVPLNAGWGRTYEEMVRNLEDYQFLLTRAASSEDEARLMETAQRLASFFIFRWAYELDSPHGYLNQNNILGMRDTGGQIVYLRNYIHQLAPLLQAKAERAGFYEGVTQADWLMPQVILVSRLMPENTLLAGVEEGYRRGVEALQAAVEDRIPGQNLSAEQKTRKAVELSEGMAQLAQEREKGVVQAVEDWSRIKSYEPVEIFLGADGKSLPNAVILRFPFRDEAGDVKKEFIPRQEVWPWMMRFAKDVHQGVGAYLRKKGLPENRLRIGQYSDGSLVALLGAVLSGDVYAAVPHAFERPKWREETADGVMTYPEDRYENAAIQYYLDVVTMVLGPYLLFSSNESEREQVVDAVSGLIQNPEQWALLSRLGRRKVSVGHLGVSPGLLNLNRKPEGLNKEFLFFKEVYDALRQRAGDEHISEGRRRALLAAARQMAEHHRERFDPVMPAQAFQQQFLQDIPQNISAPEGVVVFYSVSRMAPEKNPLALIKPLLGTPDLRRRLAAYLRDVDELAVKYASELARLERGGLPAVFLEEGFRDHMEDRDLAERLKEVWDLRERSLMVMIGGKPEDALYNTFVSTIRENQLENQVALFSGGDNEVVYPVMWALDQIFVQPAWNEPYGITFLEGMLGGGLMATRFSGAMDLIRHDPDLSPFLFDPRDEEDQARVVKRYMAMSPGERQELNKKFRAVVTDMAGWERKAVTTVNFLNHITLMEAAPQERAKTRAANRAMLGDILKIFRERVQPRYSQAVGDILLPVFAPLLESALEGVGGIDMTDIPLRLAGPGLAGVIPRDNLSEEDGLLQVQGCQMTILNIRPLPSLAF